jgi:hypothetical protein
MHADWNRRLVWSKHDRSRQTRLRKLATVGIIAAISIGIATTYACVELLLVDDDVRSRIDVVARDEPDECTADTDCVILPALVTCCGECEPVPPFDAARRTILEDLRSDCVPRERLCDPPVCSPKPPGCEARAACVRGRCRVVANDRCESRIERASPR